MSYIWNIWIILLWTVTPFALMATIRLSLKGMVKIPENIVIKTVANEGWCIAILLLIPWHISAFAKGEISPLPWKAFMAHGISDGILNFLMICIVNIWLLWTPARIYSAGLVKSERAKGHFAHVVNALLGLLLMTPGNPVYRVIEAFL